MRRYSIMKQALTYSGGIYILLFFITTLYAQIGEQQKDDVSLEKLLNETINTAAKYEQTVSEAAASVTIITTEDIERYGYRTLDEILTRIRGFYTRYDRSYSYLGVRGFSRPTDFNNRILILLNGHILNENVYGTATIGTDLGLNLDAIERIEIVRGPGSVLYGAGAMFAVINIITKKGNTIDGTKISAEAGSFGRIKGSTTFGKQLENGMDIAVAGLWADIDGQYLYFKEFDTPSTNNGIADNLDWDKYYGFLSTIAYHNFTIQGTITSRKKGNPTGSYETVFNKYSSTLDARKFIDVNYETAIDVNKHIMMRGYYDHYDYRGVYPYENYVQKEATINHWQGLEAQFLWDVRQNDRLILGTEYKNDSKASYKSEYATEVQYNSNFPFHIFSIYFQNEYQVHNNLSFVLGTRWDRYSTVGNSVTPRAAIIYNPHKSSTLKLLYGEAFRAPNVYETYYEESGLAKSNPHLKPEKIKTAELVWEQQLNTAFSGVVSLYNYDMKNLIDQTIDPYDLLSQFRNVSRVKAQGIEFELNAHLESGFWGYINFIFQRAEDNLLKKKLTDSPSHLMKLGFSNSLFKKFYTAVEFEYEASRTNVYGKKNNEFLLTTINFSSKPLFRHIKFSFLVRNLFDVRYALPGGFEHIQQGIFQDGRNYSVKMDFKF